MLRIDNTIFSFDILEKKFICDLPHCQGSCCRYGDAGAPLSPDEASKLNGIWPVVEPYLREEGRKAVVALGKSVIDADGEPVTPLIDNRECAYTIISNGIYLCAIEKAWAEGKTDFRKPLSCHLFPARIKQFSDFVAVNYSEQPVCESARRLGNDRGIYVYQFLKTPLIRAFGEKLYEELCIAAEELRKLKKKDRRV